MKKPKPELPELQAAAEFEQLVCDSAYFLDLLSEVDTSDLSARLQIVSRLIAAIPGDITAASLVGYTGSQSVNTPIPDNGLTVGRASTADYTIALDGVSRHHFRISLRSPEQYWIKDLDSTNGIYINGQKTKAQALRSGDIVASHSFLFAFIDGT